MFLVAGLLAAAFLGAGCVKEPPLEPDNAPSGDDPTAAASPDESTQETIPGTNRTVERSTRSGGTELTAWMENDFIRTSAHIQGFSVSRPDGLVEGSFLLEWSSESGQVFDEASLELLQDGMVIQRIHGSSPLEVSLDNTQWVKNKLQGRILPVWQEDLNAGAQVAFEWSVQIVLVKEPLQEDDASAQEPDPDSRGSKDPE